MLCLSRRRNEVIRIGDNIRLLVLDIRGAEGKVRLGVEAPKSITVHREEVYEAIKSSGETRACCHCGKSVHGVLAAERALRVSCDDCEPLMQQEKAKDLIRRLHKTAQQCDPTYFGSHMWHEAESLCQ